MPVPSSAPPSAVSAPPFALRRLAVPLLLIGLVALFLFPYLFLGRSLVPLDLIPIFQPWARHAHEIWGKVPLVHNPLLDSIQQYYPRRVSMTAALRHGWLPFWNPNVYGGSPFLATQQGAVLYPPAWLLALLPPDVQFGWSAFFHLCIAALGTFGFLRLLGAGRPAASVGAAAFAFNGWIVVWLSYPNVSQWTLCWLPAALYCWERGYRERSLRWIAASAGVLALAFLGGHGQSTDYVLLAWGLWGLYRVLTGRERGWGLLKVAGPLLLAVSLSAGHLLPVLEYVPRTDRGVRLAWSDVSHAGMPASQLLTFLLPRLFGDATDTFGHQSWLPADGKSPLAFIERTFYPGASVLVLAAAGLALLFPLRRRPPASESHPLRSLAGFSLGLTLFAILGAMGTALYWPLWAVVPGFGQFSAVGRMVSIAAWGLACLAAVGTETLLADGAIRKRAVTGLLLAALAGTAIAGVAHFVYGGAAPADVVQVLQQTGKTSPDDLALRDLVLCLVWLLFPALIGILVSGRRLAPAVAGGLLLALVVADLASFGIPYNPAADRVLLNRSTPELAALQAVPDPYRFLSCGPIGKETDVRDRMPSNLPSTLGLADISGSDSFVPLRYRAWESATQAASGWTSAWSRPGAANLKAAGVRYYLTGNRQVFDGLKPVVGAALQEDPAALPYARLHTNAHAFPNEGELLQSLAQPSRAPMIALTSGVNGVVFNGPPRVIPFAVRRKNDNRLSLTGASRLPGLLVICEGWDPGWHATVDGEPAQPIPADELFLGLPLSPGNHQIELVYEPPRYRFGFFLSLCALAVLGGCLAGSKRHRPV